MASDRRPGNQPTRCPTWTTRRRCQAWARFLYQEAEPGILPARRGRRPGPGRSSSLGRVGKGPASREEHSTPRAGTPQLPGATQAVQATVPEATVPEAPAPEVAAAIEAEAPRTVAPPRRTRGSVAPDPETSRLSADAAS